MAMTMTIIRFTMRRAILALAWRGVARNIGGGGVVCGVLIQSQALCGMQSLCSCVTVFGYDMQKAKNVIT